MGATQDPTRRDAIRRAARKLFFHFGFTKTSMDDIARQSGMAKPTLYYYYTNKESIFDEIVLEEARVFVDGIERKIDPSLAADVKLRQFMLNGYQHMKFFAQQMSDVPAYMCDHSPHGRPIVEKLNRMFCEKIQPLLREGRDRGIFECGDPALTAATIVYMAEFINHDWMMSVEESRRDAIVEQMIEMIMNGLKRRT